MARYAQKITHFFCRPCGEYHEKTHPHYRAQKRRAAMDKALTQYLSELKALAGPAPK